MTEEYVGWLEEWEPVIDMDQEIVRCRDCKFSRVHELQYGWPYYVWSCEAEWRADQEGGHPDVEPDGFCAWGERKVEE
jgi:hypothetical protein